MVNQFVAEAAKVLTTEAPTNGVTLRGFATYPKIATFAEVYGLKAACDRRLPDVQGAGPAGRHGHPRRRRDAAGEQVETLKKVWDDYDFFFLHYKYTDSTGEDGNFPAKVEMIEQLDAVIPEIRELKPDVLIVTGDHSTPSKLKSHSWHPVPTLLLADTCRHGRGRRSSASRLPARRAGPVRGEVPDAPGDGPRGPAGEVRGVRETLTASRCAAGEPGGRWGRWERRR